MEHVRESSGLHRGIAARFGFGSPQQAIRHCAELWRRLPRHNGAPRQEVVPAREVGDTSGVECPIHTAVKVDTGAAADRQSSRIHANLISFESGRQVVAGQSPSTFAFTEKFLVQGLDAGDGLFQFVDTKHHQIQQATQQLARRRTETTVLGQLLDHWHNAVDRQEPLVLAGRYQVRAVVEQACDGTHARYLMTAIDLHNNHRAVTVPLTQAALTFENNVLRTDQIEQADTLLETHRASCTPLEEAAHLPHRRDPTILSKKGIGRNAALITYREVLAKSAEANGPFDLLHALEEVVTKERLDRGKNFMHSEDQLEEVHAALRKCLEQRRAHNRANPVMSSPIRSRPRRQVEEMDEAGVADVAPNDPPRSPVEEVAAVLSVEAPVAPPITLPIDHRTRTVALLEAHASDNPLQLFDALADAEPHIGAFCAVQARRALSAIPGTNSGGYEYASIHDGVGVEIISSESAGAFLEPSIGFEQSEESEELPHTMSIQALLIHDLENALPALDTDADVAIKTDPFPQGLASALQTTRRGVAAAITPPAEKLSAEHIDQFFAQHANASPLQLMENLAENNPSLTSLIHFIEHAGLLRDSYRPAQCERYDYVPGNAEEETFFTKSHDGSGQKHFPTFMAGVNRALYSGDKKWQIELDGQRHTTNSDAEVYRHVIGHALRDLQSTMPRPDSTGLYPLPVYKLLAQAVGLPQIPPYLHEHEAALIETTSKNKVDAKDAANQARQAHVEKERKIEEEKQRVAAETAKRYAALGVRNWREEHLLGTNSYQDDLLNRSIDIELALPAQAASAQMLENFKQDLTVTHHHQAVRSRGLRFPTIEDNLSWMRSSWLSVLEMLTPQQLASNRRAIEKTPSRVDCDTRILQAIAEHYRQNPAAFLQGKAVVSIDDPDDVIPRHAAFDFEAILGSPLPLDQVLPREASGPLPLSSHDNAESFLSEQQLIMAMAYRAQYQGIEGELATLLITPGPARSTLPIALHRALGVPLLLVEKFGGAGANQSAGRLRMTAPVDSEMAQKFTALKNQSTIDGDVMSSLAIDLSTTPVMWKEGTRHSIYLPKNSADKKVSSDDEGQVALPTRSADAQAKNTRWNWSRASGR